MWLIRSDLLKRSHLAACPKYGAFTSIISRFQAKSAGWQKEAEPISAGCLLTDLPVKLVADLHGFRCALW